MEIVSKRDALTIMLNLMDDIDAICNKYNLQYFLAYGTLIGAVRHKGIIPWDDDMDIMMPRGDYEKFIQIYEKEGQYSITSPCSKNPLYYFAKIYNKNTIKKEKGISYKKFTPLGVDVDIFPLDNYLGLPTNNLVKNKWIFRMLYFFRGFAIDRITTQKSRKYPILSYLLGVLSHIVGNKIVMIIYERIAKHNNLKKSNLLTVYSGMENLSIFNKSDFSSYLVFPFEDRKYRIPIGYDNILKAIYGDYMKLPPKEMQKSHHLNVIFWRNK